MRFPSTLLGTALVAFGGVASAGAWAAPMAAGQPSSPGAGAGHALPVVDALMLAAALDTTELVTIDGMRWRRAPASEVGTTGRAGSRIILDGDLWLRADDAVFKGDVAVGRKPVTEGKPVIDGRSVVKEEPVVKGGPAVEGGPVAETPAELRLRQRRLMREARQRESARSDAASARAQARVHVRDEVRFSGLAARSAVTRRDRELAEGSMRDSAVERTAAAQAAAARQAAEEAAEEAATFRAAERAAEKAAAAQAVAEQAADEAAIAQNMTASALRLPSDERGGSSAFSYVQVMPVSYDIGGAGVMLEGSTEMRERFHLMVRAGIADRYQEALVGAGVHYTPPTADRLTLMLSAGYEYGVFPLESARTGVSVDDASSGPFVTAAGRLVLNPRFMIEGGVGYSSFHEGDPIGFGSGFFHVNDVLDLMSRIELGDQDSYGIGIRVNY